MREVLWATARSNRVTAPSGGEGAALRPFDALREEVREAGSLTGEQFHALLTELHEPFATMALLSVCLGLRISEALALRWSDVDWLGSRLSGPQMPRRSDTSVRIPSGTPTAHGSTPWARRLPCNRR